MHATLEAFGYPNTLIRAYEHWAVVLRPAQVTIGSLVLAHTGPAERLSDVPPEAFAELHAVTSDLEGTLRTVFGYDKINYLMLMMVDPNVHFHVIPRYSSERSACGLTSLDAGWPKTPALGEFVEPSADQARELIELIKSNWG